MINATTGMVSKGIEITNADYRLKFWEFSSDIDADFYDKATVLISSSSRDPESGDFVEVFETELNLNIWEQRNIDLSAYVGETIYVAFRYEGTYHRWFIDEVSIAPNNFTDAQLDGFILPLGVSENPVTSDVRVAVTNNGTTTLSEIIIDWSVNGVDQSPVTIDGLNLAPAGSINIDLGSYNFDQTGYYNMQAEVIVNNDFEPANNIAENRFEVAPATDAFVTEITPESTIPSEGERDVKVLVTNQGENPIGRIFINWSVNEIEQNQYSNDNFNLQPGQSTEVVLGSYNFTSGSYQINTELNALGDINDANDKYLAQVYVNTFVESFEGTSFPPEGWTMEFNVRDGSNFGEAVEGEYYISNLVDDNYFGVVTDTIFTPLLDIKEGDTFGFYIQSALASPINASLIWKNEETGEVNTISEIEPSEGFNNWEYRVYDISAAAGANRIGILSLPNGSYGSSKFDLFSSDASLYQYQKDARLLDVKSNFIARLNTPESFDITLRNAGSTTLFGREYSILLKDEGGNLLATYGGQIIQPWEKETITVNYTFIELGAKKIYFEIEYADDENTVDNTSFIYMLGVVPETSVLAEIGSKDLPSPGIPFSPNGNTNSLGEDDLTQLFYYQDEINAAGYVYGMTYTYQNLQSSTDIKKYPLKVWISQTDRENMSAGWDDQDNLQLVFDGVVDIFPGGDNELYIPFDEPVLLNGINNVIIQNYQYDPEWPPSIFRMYTTNTAEGPVRTIGSLDVFDLDPNTPPDGFFSITDYVFTRFVIDPANNFSAMFGTLTDSGDGEGINNASIELNQAVVNTTTNTNGDYQFQSLPFGSYEFTISSEGYESKTVEVVLSETNQEVNISLDQLLELQVSGVVYGDNNISAPLKNVTLNLILEDGTLEETTSSDANGEFTFLSVYGTFNYKIEVSMYGYFTQMIELSPVDSNIDLGDIILEEEFISPILVGVDSDGGDPLVSWTSPKKSRKDKLGYDSGFISNSFTNEPNENVWLGNYFNFEEPTTLNSVEIRTDVFQNATDFVTVDVIDLASDEVLATSEPFLIQQNTEQTVNIPNITVSGLIAVMVHWQDNPESTNSLAIEFSEEGMFDGAVIKFPGEATTLFSSFINAPDGFTAAFLLRVNALTEDDPVTNGEEVFYNVYRGVADTFPDISEWELLNQNVVVGTEFSDTVSGADPAEFYRYAIEGIYTNGVSEVTFSNPISGASLGLEDISMKATELKIFPNPAKNVVNLFVPSIASLDGSIEVFDVLGKLVLEVKSVNYSNVQQLDISSLQNGVYILKCYLNNDITVTKKLIVR
jgi:hypothetical protein